MIRRTLAPFKHRMVHALNDLRHPRFGEVRRAGRGLLSARVYAHLYQTVLAAEALDIIDVGAAGGASSVAMALALKAAGRTSRVIAVEKCEGGSRVEHGGYADNRTFLEQTVQRFDVADRVTLFPHHLTLASSADLLRLVRTARLAGFMLDADGHLHRDFAILGPLLAERNFVIVDDYAPTIQYRPISDRYPMGGTKKQIVYRLLNYLIDQGFFVVSHRIGATVFGHVPVGADLSRLDHDHCTRIITEIQAEHRTAIDA